MRLWSKLFSAILVMGICSSFNLDAGMKKLFKKINGASKETTYDRLKNEEITPQAGPSTKEGVGVALDFEYLYWYMSQDGLNFVATDYTNQKNQTLVGSNSTAAPTEAYYGGKGGSSGFKAGIGIDFDYDGWDLNLLYTRYKHQDVEKKDGGAQGLNSLIALQDIYYMNYAHSHFRLMLNAVDVDLARAFYITPKIIVRPFLGGKGAWGHQYFSVHFDSSGTDYYPAQNENDYFIKNINTQSNFGFGSRAGCDLSWLLTSRLSLKGKCGLTCLWQYFKANRQDYYDITDLDTGALFLNNYQDLNYFNSYHTVNPVLETKIGFCYDYLFSDSEYRLRIEAAWENQVWFCQNAFLTNFGQNQAKGNLRLQGLNFSLRIDF